METIIKFARNWGDVLASLVTGAITGWEMYLNANGESAFADKPGIPVAIGWVVFVMLVLFAIIRRQVALNTIENSRAVIRLRDFGLEIKTWRSKPPHIAIYAELENAPHPSAINANAEKVYPQIVWEDLISGQVYETNPGRWVIPNREKAQTIELLAVNLEANGSAKKLQIGAIEKLDGCIRAIWRDEDDKYHEDVFRNDNKHKATLTLRDTKGSSAEFLFNVSKHRAPKHPFYILKRIGKDGKAIGKPKRFDLKDLPDKSPDYAFVPTTRST